jgi:hypothetical protein
VSDVKDKPSRPVAEVDTSQKAFVPSEEAGIGRKAMYTEEENEYTVESLSANAFDDEESGDSITITESRNKILGEIQQAELAERSTSATEVATMTVPDDTTPIADDLGDEQTAEPPRQVLDSPAPDDSSTEEEADRAHKLYRHMLNDEISFSRATGYDREQTAIVPLAELARREENRLQQAQAPVEENERWHKIPVGEIIDILRATRTVEEVAGVLVEMVAQIIPQVMLLWERHGFLYGFASRGTGLSEVKLLTIEMPTHVFQEMTEGGLDLRSFIGPPRTGGLVDRFFSILGHTPPELLMIPIQVTGRDRWILYADNGDDHLPEFELRLLEVLASRAGARTDWLLDKQQVW